MQKNKTSEKKKKAKGQRDAKRKASGRVVPNRDKEFKMYVLWKSLPPLLRNELHKNPAIWKQTGFGDNPVIEELLKLKTQQEFADAFGVSKDTLSIWNNTIERRDLLGDFRLWAKHLTHNLLMSMYNKGIKYGDPYRVELWLKSIHGWKETTEVEVNVGTTLADVMKNTLKKHRHAQNKDTKTK
jgi:hypothetical protein